MLLSLSPLPVTTTSTTTISSTTGFRFLFFQKIMLAYGMQGILREVTSGAIMLGMTQPMTLLVILIFLIIQVEALLWEEITYL